MAIAIPSTLNANKRHYLQYSAMQPLRALSTVHHGQICPFLPSAVTYWSTQRATTHQHSRSSYPSFDFANLEAAFKIWEVRKLKEALISLVYVKLHTQPPSWWPDSSSAHSATGCFGKSATHTILSSYFSIANTPAITLIPLKLIYFSVTFFEGANLPDRNACNISRFTLSTPNNLWFLFAHASMLRFAHTHAKFLVASLASIRKLINDLPLIVTVHKKRQLKCFSFISNVLRRMQLQAFHSVRPIRPDSEGAERGSHNI